MLEVRDLSKAFGGLKAVDHASLDVREGEIVGLIGPNGAGKTTLFAAIAGFHKPDGGRIVFEGRDITGLEPHRICAAGMVRTFQVTQPFARISVRENIMVGGAGTIFGPLIGSIVLTAINELTRNAASVFPALKNVQPLSLIVYGAMLILIVARLPDGFASLLWRRRHA